MSSSYISSTPPILPLPSSHHQSRASLTSLYDLLADLDDSQLSYLISEMNHTASQNMAVSQAVSAFESSDPSYSLSTARANMQKPTMTRQLSKSQKMRLSLQTMFRQSSARQQHRRKRSDDVEVDDANDNGLLHTPIGRRRSPAYKRISRPNFNLPPGVTIADLLHLLEAEFLYANSAASPLSPLSTSASSSFSATPSPTTSHGSGRQIRRYPSTIDMALEAERSADGAEGIGLGMLEPRPMTPCTSIGRSSSFGRDVSPIPSLRERLRGDTPPPAPPVVLEGIFEVLEHR